MNHSKKWRGSDQAQDLLRLSRVLPRFCERGRNQAQELQVQPQEVNSQVLRQELQGNVPDLSRELLQEL